MNTQVSSKIKILIETVHQHSSFSTNELYKLLCKLKITRSDLKPFERFNHALYESYGRYVLYESPKLEVVVMSWNKGDYTSIHDHGATQWGAVLCFGKLEHASFELHHNDLNIAERMVFDDDDICLVTNQLIHQMGNPFDQPAMTLHVYGADSGVSEVTGNARNYDPLQEKVFYANGGAFLKIEEQNITKVEKCPLVQDEIYRHSAQILLNYEIRIREKQIELSNRKWQKNVVEAL